MSAAKPRPGRAYSHPPRPVQRPRAQVRPPVGRGGEHVAPARGAAELFQHATYASPPTAPYCALTPVDTARLRTGPDRCTLGLRLGVTGLSRVVSYPRQAAQQVTHGLGPGWNSRGLREREAFSPGRTAPPGKHNGRSRHPPQERPRPLLTGRAAARVQYSVGGPVCVTPGTYGWWTGVDGARFQVVTCLSRRTAERLDNAARWGTSGGNTQGSAELGTRVQGCWGTTRS